MFRLVAGTLILGAWWAGSNAVRADDTPRAIIERAIKAQGGNLQSGAPKAVKTKIKGVLHEDSVGDLPFTGELVVQYPNQFKHTAQVGNDLTLVEVLNGNRGWLRDNEQCNEADADGLAEMQHAAYVDHVATLFPLLQDKSITLSILGEAKIQGGTAVGVKVQAAGKPEVSLYFDKDSGLLVKTRYRRRDAREKKEFVKEEIFSNYKEVIPAGADSETLKKANLSEDDAALLDFIRKRTLTDAELATLDGLARKLGDSSFDVREKAKQDLLAQGNKAIPVLTRALKDTDPEVRDAAKECLQRVGKAKDNEELIAAIRQLARRRTVGAAEVLLAYVPSVPDEKIGQEVQGALAAVAYRDGQPEKTLTQAAEGKDPLRSAAAKAVLASSGKSTNEASGHPVLLFGFKVPMKGEEYSDGKKVWEWEVTEIQFFDKLEDSNFRKP